MGITVPVSINHICINSRICICYFPGNVFERFLIQMLRIILKLNLTQTVRICIRFVQDISIPLPRIISSCQLKKLGCFFFISMFQAVLLDKFLPSYSFLRHLNADQDFPFFKMNPRQSYAAYRQPGLNILPL